MQKPTNAKTNCNKYSASNKEIEEDHAKDGQTRVMMGIKKRQTMAQNVGKGRRLYWKLGAQRAVVNDQKHRKRKKNKNKKKSNKYNNNDEENDHKKMTKNTKKTVNH
jgi:hypothetical protein